MTFLLVIFPTRENVPKCILFGIFSLRVYFIFLQFLHFSFPIYTRLSAFLIKHNIISAILSGICYTLLTMNGWDFIEIWGYSTRAAGRKKFKSETDGSQIFPGFHGLPSELPVRRAHLAYLNLDCIRI